MFPVIRSIKKDGPVCISKVREDDAAQVLELLRNVFDNYDTTLTAIQEFKFGIEEERNFISQVQSQPNSILMGAFIEEKIVGLLGIHGSDKLKTSHTAELGISVHSEFQNLEVASHLLEIAVNWSRENKLIEILYLQVFVRNQFAVRLYEKFGFEAYALRKNYIKQIDGRYDNVLEMELNVKN